VDLAPVFFGRIDHDVDEHGHEHGEQVGAVANLDAVDAAFPGGAAVHELVAQDVEAVEDFREEEGDAPMGKVAQGVCLVLVEAPPPLGVSRVAGDGPLSFPEGLEHVGVLNDRADGA
jgi:hypothetical protein